MASHSGSKAGDAVRIEMAVGLKDCVVGQHRDPVAHDLRDDRAAQRRFRDGAVARAQHAVYNMTELLRARVTRDNQVPVLLQAKTTRELSYLRLKQLLNLPYSDSLVLTDGIGDVEPEPGCSLECVEVVVEVS